MRTECEQEIPDQLKIKASREGGKSYLPGLAQLVLLAVVGNALLWDKAEGDVADRGDRETNKLTAEKKKKKGSLWKDVGKM